MIQNPGTLSETVWLEHLMTSLGSRRESFGALFVEISAMRRNSSSSFSHGPLWLRFNENLFAIPVPRLKEVKHEAPSFCLISGANTRRSL
jgi:hypothetical protein